jgi:hypothetical protein
MKNSGTRMLNKINIDDKLVPVILLFFLIASFGLLIPKLGFYWDDWPVIFMTQTQGNAGFWDFYQYDRPFSAWTYILSAPIIGTRPIGWHIFSLMLRWLTVVFVWLSHPDALAQQTQAGFLDCTVVFSVPNIQPAAGSRSIQPTLDLLSFLLCFNLPDALIPRSINGSVFT